MQAVSVALSEKRALVDRNLLHAVSVALSVKRALVDRNLLNVTHEAFQKLLFLHLAEHNLGAATIRRFLLVARFFALRTPFVLLLGGPPCCLKSTLAQALAAALNMPNVQQTDVAFSLLRRNRMQLPKLWRRGCANEAEVLHWYRQEAALVRRAIDADLRKARQSGKPLIVEGLHVDPGLFLVELGVLPAIQARMHARQQSASPEAFDDTILHTQAVADAMVAQRVSDEDSLCQQVPADTSPPNQNLTGGPAIPPSPGGHLSRHAGVASGDAIDVGQPQHTTTRTGSKHVHVTSKSHGASFQDVYSSDIFIVQAQARSPDDALSTARALLCARCAHSTGRPALATAELQMHLDWYGKPVVDAELAGATMGSWPVAEGADDEGLSKEERVSAWLSSDAAGSVSGHGEVVLHGVQDTGHGFRASRGRSETGDLSLSMYGVSSPLDAAKCLGVEDAAGGAEIGDAWRKGNTRGRVGATEASGEVTGSQMEVEGAQREESAGGEARVVDTSREETVGGKSEVGGERPGESAGGRAEVGKISSAAHVSDRAARSGAPGDEEGAGKIGGAAVKGAGTNAATWSEAEWAFGDVRQSDTPQLQACSVTSEQQHKAEEIASSCELMRTFVEEQTQRSVFGKMVTEVVAATEPMLQAMTTDWPLVIPMAVVLHACDAPLQQAAAHQQTSSRSLAKAPFGGVPVFEVHLGNISEVLDSMLQYVLTCIEQSCGVSQSAGTGVVD